MKITWYSNAPWAGTGYGTQTAQVVPRLINAGHQPVIMANYGLHGSILRWNGIEIFPAGTDTYSNDVLAGAHEAWLAEGDYHLGWLLTLFDVWVLDPEPLKGSRVASWTPVDHSPVPPKVAEWAKSHRTIAMSRFGQEQLAVQGIKSDYIPHAIEPVFRPTSNDAKSQWELPDDAFLVMINAANKGNVPPRKAWAEMFGGFSIFAKKHPDAYLYVHTDVKGIGGVDLLLLAIASGIDPTHVRWADQFSYKVGGTTPDVLAKLYSAADVLLATSMGEGFGLPVIEAQACGTSVIVTDFSAQPELVGGGWKVAAQPYWDFGQAARLAMPILADIVHKLDDAYDARNDTSIKQAAIDKAMEYDADLVFDTYWKPLLAELEAECTAKPSRASRRAEKRRRKAA